MACVHVGVHLPALAHAWACKQYVFWTAHVFVCVCVGECAPACLPACRPACVRACSRMWMCARAGMSADVPSNPAVGLLWISSRLQGMGIPFPFTALPGSKKGRMPSFSCRLTAAAPRCDCGCGFVFWGLSFQRCVCVKVEWLCTSYWL